MAKQIHVPFPVEYALRLFVGIVVNITLTTMCIIAFIMEMFRHLFGLPDRGTPKETTAYVTPIGGVTSCEVQLESDDDAVADIEFEPDVDSGRKAGAQPMVKVQQVTHLPPLAKGSVQVVHIQVDAEAGADSDAWKVVGPYLRAYGTGALSSSTLWNPEYYHMFVPGMGSQPYVVGRAYWRTIVVGVGDPLAHKQHWPEMAAAFKRAFPSSTFAHVGPEYARILRDNHKMVVNDMGAETNILAQKWGYSKKTRQIRQSARDAKNAGVDVRELFPGDLTPEVCHQLAHVTGDWIQQKAVGDNMLRVFIRHVDYNNLHLDEGVRLFVAQNRNTGAIDGFILADPLWQDGQVYGYVTSLNRMRRSGHPGTLKLLYEELIAVCKKEGKEIMTFGFSPFFNLQTKPFMGALWTEGASRFLFNFGNNLYQFKTLAFSKARYGGSVVGDAYKDPNVTMTHVYGATYCKHIDMGMLDLYILLMYVGFFGDLVDTLFKLAGLRSSLGNSLDDSAPTGLPLAGASTVSLQSMAGPGKGCDE